MVPGSAAGAADAPKPAPAKGVTPPLYRQVFSAAEPIGEKVIADALAAGYRCFDCAQFYENEAIWHMMNLSAKHIQSSLFLF